MDRRPPPRRALLRALALAASLVALTACGANQSDYPHLMDPEYAESSSLTRTVLLYVVAPVLIAAAVSLPTFILGARRKARYRPNEGWDAEPVWFAGPPDPVAAVEQAQTGDVVRGGAGGSW